MKRTWPISTRLLVALIAWVLTLDAKANEYQDAKHHFSVTLPKGWSAGSERMVEIANRDRVKRSPVTTPYVGYFFRAGPPDTLYPHVLVSWQQDSFAGASYEEIEKELGLAASDPAFQEELRQTAESLKHLILHRSTGKPILDRSRNCLVIRSKVNSVEDGKLQTLTIGFLGKDGILRMQLWEKDEDFDKSVDEFTTLLDTFRWDAGHEFRPKPSVQRQSLQHMPPKTGDDSAPLVFFGVSSGAVALVLLLLAYRRRVRGS